MTTNLFAPDDHRRPTVGFAGHAGDCRCAACMGRRERFGGKVARLGLGLTCEACGLDLPALRFPKLPDGSRGQPCRNCRPHSPSLPEPVEVGE